MVGLIVGLIATTVVRLVVGLVATAMVGLIATAVILLFSLNGGNFDLVGIVSTVGSSICQIGVAVCGILSTCLVAFLSGVNSNLVNHAVVIGTEECAVLYTPGKEVDSAAHVACNIRSACSKLCAANKLNVDGRLSGKGSYALCPTVSVCPNDIAGYVVNDLKSVKIDVYPLTHVVGNSNVVVGSGCEGGDGGSKSLNQTCDTGGENEGGLIVAKLHPSALGIIVYNVKVVDLLHICKCISSGRSTGPAIAVGYVCALVGGIVEEILNIGAVLLVVLNESTLSIGNGVCFAAGETRVCIYVGPELLSECDEFFVGYLTAECSVKDFLFCSGAIKAITEYGGKCCGEILSVKYSLLKCNLCYGRCAKLGPSLPVSVKCAGSLVGVNVTVGNEDYVYLAESFIVVCDIFSNAGKACLAVSGGTAVKEVAGKLTKSSFKISGALNVNKNLVVSHTERHKSKLGVAVVVKNSRTDGVDSFLHSRPLIVHRVRAVNHKDNFIVGLFSVAAGNSDGNLVLAVLDLLSLLVCNKVAVFNLSKCLCINGGFVACNTDKVLRNLAAGCNTVAVNILRLGLVEVYTAFKVLSTGYNNLNLCALCSSYGNGVKLLTCNYVNSLSNSFTNVYVDNYTIISVTGVVESYVENEIHLRATLINGLGVHNVKLRDYNLTCLCVNAFHCKIEVDESVYTVTNTVGVREVLSGACAISEISDLTCKLVHIAAPSKLLSGGCSLVVTIRVAAVGVSDSPDSSLSSGNKLGAVKLVSLCKSCLLKCSLCFLDRNVRISISYDSAELLCIRITNVLAVLKVYALIIDLAISTGSSVAAVHNVVVAYAALVNAVGSPITGNFGGIDHGEDVNCATAGYFLLNRVVAGLIVPTIVVGILRDCIHVGTFAGCDVKLCIIALPNCLCCEYRHCNSSDHYKCKYKREHHLEILCHFVISFLREIPVAGLS